MANIQAYTAMLVLPGGGFRFCSDREGEPVAMAYFAEGYQTFVLDYTTVTKKPDATIEDPMRDAAAEKSPFMKEITIRQITGMMPGMDGEKLALLDERLLALG